MCRFENLKLKTTNDLLKTQCAIMNLSKHKQQNNKIKATDMKKQ